MKLDKSYKVRVTPEQSKVIHDLMGKDYNDGYDYLYINSLGIFTYTNSRHFFDLHHFVKIQADDLIALLTDLSKSAENPLQNMKLTPEFEAVDPVIADNCQVNIQDIGTDILDTNADIKDTPKFKVGDKVYWGLKSRIFKVYRLMTANVLQVELDDCVVDVHKDELCPATLENYGKLCSLFECIDFEQPPKPLSGDGLVRAMLTKGIKNVLCLWVNGDKIVIDGLDCKGALVSINNNIVSGLTPIDWYTGEPLTEAMLDE